jgi:hypothetical protein
MAILFAAAIVSIPFIEAINIADNHLSDRGLGPIVDACTHMTLLVELDISYNVIGVYMYICICMYMYIPIYSYTHILIYSYTHIPITSYTYTYIHTTS